MTEMAGAKPADNSFMHERIFMIKSIWDEISNHLNSFQYGRNRVEWDHISKNKPLDFSEIDAAERAFVNLDLIESLVCDSRITRLSKLKLILKYIDLDPDICRLNDALLSIVEDNRDLIVTMNNAESKDEIDRVRLVNAELSKQSSTTLNHLISQRNRLARTFGYLDFVELAYEYFEIDCQKMIAYVTGLCKNETGKLEDYKAIVKSWTGADDHWIGRIDLEKHLSEKFCGFDMVEPLRKLIDSWGLGNVFDRIRIVIANNGELYTRCIPLSIPDDIIVFVDTLNALRDCDSIFHEFGHGIHFAVMQNSGFVEVNEPLMMEIPSVFFNYIERGADWANIVFPQASSQEREMLQYSRLVNNPGMIVGQCFDALFEIECYKKEGQSLDIIYRNLYSRLFGKDTNDSANLQGIDFSWPFYQQSYLLGFGFSKLLYENFMERFGTVFDEKVGKMFTDTLLVPGNSVKFTDRMQSLIDKLGIKDIPTWMSSIL